MKCVGSVVQLLSLLGILAMGLSPVAQAARADRKAQQVERENRVLTAVKARLSANLNAKASPKISQSLNKSERDYIRSLVAAEVRSLQYQNSLIAAENTLIAQQNRVASHLILPVNPFRDRPLVEQATLLQTAINRDLTFLNAIQPAINAGLTALQAYTSVIPGIVNAIEQVVVRNEQAVAVIAARPPFTFPPATPAI